VSPVRDTLIEARRSPLDPVHRRGQALGLSRRARPRQASHAVTDAHDVKTIAVVGATGLQDSAVTRKLLREGWRVRALTRDPNGQRARDLAALGAEVMGSDAADPASLERSFAGVHGVYSVQNHHIAGYEGEVRQGRNVADVVARAGVAHLVYASAGTGIAGTGIGSWETKVEVAEHARRSGAPLTVLRPMAFMELMTERKFYPRPPSGI
jgi:uncharacterized protein YbjT (DUF2867 family)